ncbi:MAG: type II toxin-antitoxin system HipA family toxin [Stenotrophomonas rhizophila]|uniref:type II toxin-antitoxin system HipA family toxin n=1 Tax=Stenotrophomonas rhizophila TaxID=216778 RepID=UPI003D0E6D0A
MLHVLMQGRPMGLLHMDDHGNPHFVYDRQWLASADAFPLSISLPLNRPTHPSAAVGAVIWGLLPDNDTILQGWGSRFHVSPRNPVALLAHVGEDCAGAVQFVTPERLPHVLSGAADGIERLSSADVAARLSQVRRDVGSGRWLGDIGQFSLAGAQAKIALLRLDDGWAVPSGRIPTTHILKPPGTDYTGFVENEMFCLRLARAMGLPTAASEQWELAGETAICVERYDRLQTEAGWVRVHQEDFCQALGVMPQIKYQNEGGPGAADLAGVLWAHASQPRRDVELFFNALVFNYLIAGTDAHAKNYSLLLGSGGEIRLAPLYDISSALPYPQLQKRKIKLAMKMGSHYRWWDIRLGDWRATAEAMRLDSDAAMKSLASMCLQLPDVASQQRQLLQQEGIDHPVLETLVHEIERSCERCLRQFSISA